MGELEQYHIHRRAGTATPIITYLSPHLLSHQDQSSTAQILTKDIHLLTVELWLFLILKRDGTVTLNTIWLNREHLVLMSRRLSIAQTLTKDSHSRTEEQ